MTSQPRCCEAQSDRRMRTDKTFLYVGKNAMIKLIIYGATVQFGRSGGPAIAEARTQEFADTQSAVHIAEMFDVKTHRATHYGLSVVYTPIVEVKQSDYFHLGFLIPTHHRNGRNSLRTTFSRVRFVKNPFGRRRR